MYPERSSGFSECFKLLKKKERKKETKPSLAERQEDKLRQSRQAEGLPAPGASLSTEHRGFFVRKQEQGIILAGRALPEEVMRPAC